MKIYIAGGITHNKNYISDFKVAEEHLRSLGHIPINPCKCEGQSYKWYIDEGLKQLMECEAIYLLNGWQYSKGACLELQYASTVGMVIHKEKDNDVPFWITNGQ